MFRYFRMSPERFDQLLELVKPTIEKNTTYVSQYQLQKDFLLPYVSWQLETRHSL